MQHQTFDPDTPRQIEARLNDDRKVLSSALSALGAKFTPEALWSSGVTMIKSNSGPYTQAVDRAVRGNPMAVAITAVGLAWLVLGRRHGSDTDQVPLPGTHTESVARWEDEGGPVTERLSETPGIDDFWTKDADTLRLRANTLIAQIDKASRKRNAPHAELARHRLDIVTSLTKDVRQVMARGMEHLTDDARKLALDGRERAYALHVQKPKMMAKAMAKAKSVSQQDTPLFTAAALAAAGAALGAMLPRSDMENQALGAPRDRLVDTVRLALRDERQLLSKSVQRVAQSLLADPLLPEAQSESGSDRW